MTSISETIQNGFADKKVVIVGDLVADQFLRGTINRVSREAPVFIMTHDETEMLAGGAGNAAVNVSSLTGSAVAVGLVGGDSEGKELISALERSSVDCTHVVVQTDLRTTTKVRVLAGQHYAQRQQVIRIDYENKRAIDADTFDKLKQNVLEATKEADAIIISDYNYGVANIEITALCAEISRKKDIPLLIDSRARLKEFRGATTATPNQEEVEQILGKDFTEEDCAHLRKELDLEALLITKGNEGMLLLEKGKRVVNMDAIGAKEPIDVTGAGDTVIATYALGLASGLSFSKSAQLANHAGGLVVMKQGTASVTLEELHNSVITNSNDHKIQTRECV